MSDREQSPPMDVVCEVDRQPADGDQVAPADGDQVAPADGDQAAPVDGEQQVDDAQIMIDDDDEDVEYEDDEGDESDCDDEETDDGDEESNGEANESDGEANESDGEVDESAGLRNVGRDQPADEAPRGQYDYVYLRLISDIHPDEGFLVKTTEPMRNMKQLHHSQLNETQKQSLKQYFLYNGNLINDDDTPQSLGLLETDDIHVFHTMGEGIRVHTIETGEVRQLQL